MSISFFRCSKSSTINLSDLKFPLPFSSRLNNSSLILFSLNLFTNLDNELLDLLKANISTLNPKFNKKSIHSTSKSSKCFLDSSHMKTKSISSPLKAKNGLKELKLSLFKFILLIIDSSWSLENLENMEFTTSIAENSTLMPCFSNSLSMNLKNLLPKYLSNMIK